MVFDMLNMMDTLDNTEIKKNELAVGWVGQSGFIFKTSSNMTIAIDIYLSNAVERVWGLKRLMAPMLSPLDLKADILIATHFHEDHLDIDSLTQIMESNKTVLLSPSSSIDKVKDIIDINKFQRFDQGDVFSSGDLIIEAVYADHGDFIEDPIGILLRSDDIYIYFCGDTALRPEKMQRAIDSEPDIIIPPINGENWNMDHSEAALLTKLCKSKTAIPCHYWMFAEHRGDPWLFKKAIYDLNINTNVLMLCQGEIIKYQKYD